MDHFQTLGVSREATDKDIRKAFSAKALQWHPDKNPEDKGVEFMKVKKAYEVIKERIGRARYLRILQGKYNPFYRDGVDPDPGRWSTKRTHPTNQPNPTNSKRSKEEEKVSDQKVFSGPPKPSSTGVASTTAVPESPPLYYTVTPPPKYVVTPGPKKQFVCQLCGRRYRKAESLPNHKCQPRKKCPRKA
jgi:curved DNA-binding protein CbpA